LKLGRSSPKLRSFWNILALTTSLFVLSLTVYGFLLVQNFEQNELTVDSGLTIYKYETELNKSMDSKAEFDAETYSAGNFEALKDDLLAVLATDDYLRLNHYGDNPPNTSIVDWWDDDSNSATKYNWKYRKCLTLDHTTAGAVDQSDYQIYLDFDTATLVSASKMQSDGDDIRFVDSAGNLLDYHLADDMNTTSTRIWVQMDDITAATTEEICMYYGNSTATGVSSAEDTFTYSTLQALYYVIQDSADGYITDFASYFDGIQITIDLYNSILDQYEADKHPGSGVSLSQTTAISTTDPINGGYSASGTDALVPASNAGTSFVYRMDRGTNEFSIVSPWCSSNVVVRNGSGNTVTSGSFTVAAGSYHNLTTTNDSSTGIPNNDVVMIEVSNSCPILVTHHSTTGSDSFVMFPAHKEWYGVGSGRLEIAALQNSTSVTVYKSDGTSSGPTTLNRGDEMTINDTGSEGSDPAQRVVADKPIGVNSIADSDGTEAATFLPVDELGFTYYIPQDTQYIAIATTEGVSTTVDLYNDGTACGVGSPDSTHTVTPSSTYPGKVYFGSTTDGNNISAGSCIVANNPISAYYEYSTENDEHNIWNYKQNRQYVYPEPSSSFGSTQKGTWKFGSTTNEWTRRIPVTVTNNYSSAINEYQVKLDLSSLSDVFSMAQSDGGDIRVAGATGDNTDNKDFYLDAYDSTGSTGDLWYQSGSIAASGTETVYIYFRPIASFNILGLSPEVWLDAGDVDGDGQYGDNTNGALSTWEDKSGNNNDGTQSTTADQPTVNGSIVEFRGEAGDVATGDFFDMVDFDAQTFFMVLNNTLDGPSGGPNYDGIHGIVGQPVSGGDYIYLFLSTNEFGYQASFDGTVSEQGRIQLNNGTLSSFGENVGSNNFPSTQQVVYLEYQNSQSGWDNLGAFDWSSNSDYFRPNFDMMEFIAIDGTVTSTQRSNLNQYLANKWGSSQATTSLSSTGNLQNVFSTNSRYPNYYIVDSLDVDEDLEIISFADGNSVNDSFQTTTVDEGEIVDVPFSAGISDTDYFSTLGPIHAGFTSDTTDSAIPIAYAGTEFVYYAYRNTDHFSFYAPFADASVQIQQSSSSGWSTLTTSSVSTGTIVNVTQDITNGRAFKIISDEPILAFHRNNTYDSWIMYPTALGLEEDSSSYELYGIGSSYLQIAAANSGTTNVTLYRSDGTSSAVTLDSSNNYVYRESGSGSQGTAYAYHIVANGPIGATSLADADGGEAVVFVSQKEFSDTYVVANDTQYMAMVARDASVTCRVYDDTGTEVTTGSAAMDNVPPQTGGTQVDPYPNNIHIGGDDTGDGAFFTAGYYMQCTEPVYAYYEHHLDSNVTDETSWLTIPQARKRAYVEPSIEDPDSASEEGLYYESGFDSAGAGADPEGYLEFIIDGTTLTNGSHVFWNQIDWTEVVSDRTHENSVNGVEVETAYGTPAPTCAAATYTTSTPSETLLSSSVDATPPFSDETTRTLVAQIPDTHSDNECLRVRVYIRTGDEAYTPRLNNLNVSYYDPVLLEDQLNNPKVSIDGNDGAAYGSDRVRILKIINNNAGLNGSLAELVYDAVSDASVFNNADLEFLELNGGGINSQFDWPPFPGSAGTTSGSTSTLDSTHSLAIYFDHQRNGAAAETIDMEINADMVGAGGPFIRRDVQIEVAAP